MNMQEKERFHRHLIHEGFSVANQKRLRAATVLLAGIGGIGGAIAYALAGAGVGRMILVHSGRLTTSNLNRQTLMKEESIGKSRVMAAKGRLEEFSSLVHVEAHGTDITDETITPLSRGVDLIIDARHNFGERRVLNRVAMSRKLPMLFAAMDSLDLQVAFFQHEITGCLDCLYPEDPPDWDPFGFPVFGAAAHTAGAMAAMEAIKHLSGYGKAARRLTVMSLADLSTRSFPLRRLDDCPTCKGASLSLRARLPESIKNRREKDESYHGGCQGRKGMDTELYQVN